MTQPLFPSTFKPIYYYPRGTPVEVVIQCGVCKTPKRYLGTLVGANSRSYYAHVHMHVDDASCLRQYRRSDGDHTFLQECVRPLDPITALGMIVG